MDAVSDPGATLANVQYTTTNTSSTRKTLRLRSRRQGSQPSTTLSGTKDSPRRRRSIVKTEESQPLGPQSGSSRIRLSRMSHQSQGMTEERSSSTLTRTGRPKKALKGVRGAHPCVVCGKSYSRAEHLRRHQKNHTDNLRCPHPGCEKRIFHRLDLLQRHIASHDPANVREDSFTEASTGSHIPNTEALAQQSISISIEDPLGFQLPHLVDPLVVDPSVAESFSSMQQCTNVPALNILIPEPQNPHPPQILFQDPWNTFPYDSSGSSGYTSPRPAYHENSYLSQSYGGTLYRSRNNSSASSDFWRPHRPSASTSPVSDSSSQGPYYFGAQSALFSSAMATSSGSEQPIFTMAEDMQIPLTPGGDLIMSTPRGPTPFAGPLDPAYPLPLDQRLFYDIDILTQDCYMEGYWQNFHPLFPVIHRPTFNIHEAGPLITSAMMAIGAQDMGTVASTKDANKLYDNCQRYLKQLTPLLSSKAPSDLRFMQAIFLLEAFSQYKSRRASQGLSEAFLRMYSDLATSITSRSSLDELANITPTTDEQRVLDQWTAWTAIHAKQRLLLASVILEAQVTILLAREIVSGTIAGIDLPIPAPTALWDAEDARTWSNTILEAPEPTLCAHDILRNPSSVGSVMFDVFQSATLIAAYDSVFSERMLESPTSTFHLSLDQAPKLSILQSIISPDVATQTYFHMSNMARSTPLRALLAVSGESWVFSSRLANNAAEAEAKFAEKKTELQTWADNLAPQTEEASRKIALLSALRILDFAERRENRARAAKMLGYEIATYLSTLVLWAITLRAQQRTAFEFLTLDTPEPDAMAVNPFHTVPEFLHHTEADVTAGREPKSRDGVEMVVSWAKKLFRGDTAEDNELGELYEGSIIVLDKIQQKGWDHDWF